MKNDKIDQLLLSLLRQHLTQNDHIIELKLSSLCEDDWYDLYKLAAQQGVLAIAYDSLSKNIHFLPRKLKIQWALGVERIIERYNKQEKLIKELSGILFQSGIKTVVLKGLGISQYYPKPNYRECGDFDCFLFEDFNKGNEIIVNKGGTIKGEDYKHSHIDYKGLMVENHRFCTPIRGSKANKDFEIYLQALLKDEPNQYLADSHIIIPNATFTVLFLARHSMTHFLYEGINMRHIVDWACYIQKKQNEINWSEVYRLGDKMHLTIFINTLNTIVKESLGVEINNPNARIDHRYTDKFLQITLNENNNVYNQESLSLWQQRWKIVRNMIGGYWKFTKVYRKSLLMEWIRAAVGVAFEKNPKL